jgi:CheY-like chemotaxis protein
MSRSCDRRNILVVDDDASVCEALTMVLQSFGHRVRSVSSGTQALGIFEPAKFDVIITDFFMPFMTGDKLADAIKRLSPSQPVVMLTAYPEKLRAQAQPITSVDCFLGKPFEFDELSAAVTRFPISSDPLCC